MAVKVTGLGAGYDPRHVAAHAVGKGVNGVGHVLVDLDMALETLLGARGLGLGPGGRHPDLMHEMTGYAAHAFCKMFGLFPVDVLLMMGL